jgi:hypothetical protein
MLTITNPLDPKVQAIFLKAHLRLVSVGMSPPRGVRKGDLLKKATAITGKTYGRTDYKTAASDLAEYLQS